MSLQAIMILVFLVCLNSTVALYIYLRFGPRKEILLPMDESDYERYKGVQPPLKLLNSFGRRITLITYASAAASLLIVSELYLNG